MSRPAAEGRLLHGEHSSPVPLLPPLQLHPHTYDMCGYGLGGGYVTYPPPTPPHTHLQVAADLRQHPHERASAIVRRLRLQLPPRRLL
eukprot:354314-Chlamydomonas_euryale.AAC.29